MANVVRSSFVEDKPNTEVRASVSPRVFKWDIPRGVGQVATPHIQELKDILPVQDGAGTMPQVCQGAIYPADESVWAFPPVNVRQGTSTTLPTLSTSTTFTTNLKSLFTKATTFLKSPKATNSKCTTSQTATTSQIPGTNFLDNYSVILPTGAPLDPPCNIPDTTKLLPSDNQHDESNLLSEKAILEISQNGNKIQMILNSVLSFTSKCLDEGLKPKDIILLLLKHYNQKLLSESVDLARSLMKKDQRPKRVKANYQSNAPLKPFESCKLLIKIARELKKNPMFVFASFGLNVPLDYASINDNIDKFNTI